jgi:hypothetical protein
MDSYDFEVYKGSSFSLSVTLKDSDSVPIDLTDYNVSGFLKYKYSDSTKLTNLNAAKSSPYTSGIITLSIPSSGTSVLPVTLAVYDVEIYNTSTLNVEKVLRGNVSIQPEVTY